MATAAELLQNLIQCTFLQSKQPLEGNERVHLALNLIGGIGDTPLCKLYDTLVVCAQFLLYTVLIGTVWRADK